MKPLVRFVFLSLLFLESSLIAQELLPYTFENNSEYPDSEIYIGLVGKFGDNQDVWMDMTDSSLIPMSSDDNTIDGPEWSTPRAWKYPEIFTKLSVIKDNTIQIPQGLYGCRIFIAFESPMYLHFHETGGYAGANLNSSSDPNDGIRWEIVELTWGDSGLWTNTSRVDAYQYPMALEVSGFTGTITTATYAESYVSALSGTGTPKFGKIGELLSHAEILNRWEEEVSNDYLVAKVIKTHSIDGGPIIEQPSKVEAFPKTILDAYIDDIWTTYTRQQLTINIGERGAWTGSVTGEQFNFVDPEDGSIATIYRKPTSFNVIEGSGALAFTPANSSTNREKHDEDLMIQAQMAAAITRHAIYTDQFSPTVQYTHDASRFFVREPYNEYVSFFHNEAISYASQTYAFAYDDVGDHSSTIQSTFPTSVRVIIGGYDHYVAPPAELALITLSPKVDTILNGSSQQFTAQGYDQYMENYPTAISWSTTGGGTIDDTGFFTATTPGDYVITAQDGEVSRTMVIRVVSDSDDTGGETGCEGQAANGQYHYMASIDAQNPTLTFVPAERGIGQSSCLLFYGTDPEELYEAMPVTPLVPFQITAAAGATVYFYYTYSLPNGSENTTARDRHSFVVGQCTALGTAAPISFGDALVVHPNPTAGDHLFLSGLEEDVVVTIYTLQGQLLSSHEAVGVETLVIPRLQHNRFLEDRLFKSFLSNRVKVF